VTFRLHADAAARAWLDSHKPGEPLVIAYETHRCCGGGRICQVKVRALSAHDDAAKFAGGATDDGTTVLIDRRAASRLPANFGLTLRGLGRWKHLDLDLDGEQWGDLLYT
jgi:hypothetical protein